MEDKGRAKETGLCKDVAEEGVCTLEVLSWPRGHRSGGPVGEKFGEINLVGH
jgi:hypothetical protein